MILYDNALDADAYPVRLLLSALGLECERVTIDSSPLALRGLGPRGPVLEDGEARVIGAAAVLRHLAGRHGPHWRPATPGPGDAWLWLRAKCRHCKKDIKDYGGHRKYLNPLGLNLTDFWEDTAPARHRKFKARWGVNELKPVIPSRCIELSTNEGDIVLDPFAGDQFDRGLHR